MEECCKNITKSHPKEYTPEQLKATRAILSEIEGINRALQVDSVRKERIQKRLTNLGLKENKALADQLNQHTLVLLDLIGKYQPLSLRIQAPPSSSWKKLLAGLAILVGALSGALAGAALGSLAGPGGTLLGGIKGAIEAGGLAAVATLTGGAGGAVAGGCLTKYFCSRNTLFQPATSTAFLQPDARMSAVITNGECLIENFQKILPTPGK